MPPKRPHPPNTIDTDLALMPPPTIPLPLPTTPSSKRRRTSHTDTHSSTPSTTAPPSLFFTLPVPPPHDTSSPDNERPSDSQFVVFLHSIIATLPAATQALYGSAMRNLGPESTPELTGEMRASLTSAVTAFLVHLPTAEWEGDGTDGGFLTRLARGEVSGPELVVWADTITAALRAFSGIGGVWESPARTWPSPSPSSPIPHSPDPATPNRTPPVRNNPTGRSGTIRASTLTRDGNACVMTSITDPIILDAAHIIPYSVREAKADAFWSFLGPFLGVEGAERVRVAALQLGNEAAVAGELVNCMTLGSHAHRFFDAGAIEMLPVPHSGTWSDEYDPSVVSSYDVILSFPGQAFVPLHRYVYSSDTPPQLLSSTQIARGDVITLATPDPAQWPLPHPLLLQLHALCGRMKRLRAAAGWPILVYGDGSEDGVGWGEEFEVWDEDEEEEEEIQVRREGRCEGDDGAEVVSNEKAPGGRLVDTMTYMSPAGSGVGPCVLSCGARIDPETGLGLAVGGNDRKRKFAAASGEEKEVEAVGGWGGDERPRKVSVVMGELGMREEERWSLVKGSRRVDGFR